MSKSRWSNWSTGSESKPLGFAAFMAEAAVDQPGGNPTGPGSQETPAQKAERLGLISDGHGSYRDPNTNEIVARTVNGELVFYDGGEGGGATSDGEGGADQGAASTSGSGVPTYRDPDTGMVTAIPATPETPEARAAVPDHTPATAPAKFDDFIKQQKAAQAAVQAEPEEEIPAGLDDLLADILGGKKKAPKAKKATKKKEEDKNITAPKATKKAEGGPQFQSESLQAFNDLTASHAQNEADGWYDKEATRLVNEELSFDYFDKPSPVNTKFDGPEGAADLMSWSTNAHNPNIGKSLKPFWKEVENFHNNWKDPELRDENNYEAIIERTRPNRGVSEEIVNSEWNKLSNKDKKALAEMGLGGAGGRANMFLKTPEDRELRGKSILKVYLEQGGRDAWVGGEDTPPISWKDMTVDHVHSEGDSKFWKEQCRLRGLPESDYQKLANDPDVNYVMTRFGFNGAQKRDNSLEKLYTEMDKKYYKKGKEEVEDLTAGNAIKKKRKQLREQNYYEPLVKTIKESIQSGQMTPDTYNEMWETYKTGRGMLEDKNGPRTDQSQTMMDRNEHTDAWRSLAERTLFGYKIFAGDGLRAKVGGQIAGWSGVGGTTSGSNAANGEAPSYPYEDTALDFYFDPIRRLALSSEEGKKKADAIHKYTQFIGNTFVTGKIGSQEWQGYLSEVSKLMHDQLPDEWKGEYDEERASEYLTTINRTLNKLNKTKGETDGDKVAPQRDLTELFKNSPQKSLAEASIETMRALMNPEQYNVTDYYDRGNLYEHTKQDGDLLL